MEGAGGESTAMNRSTGGWGGQPGEKRGDGYGKGRRKNDGGWFRFVLGLWQQGDMGGE